MSCRAQPEPLKPPSKRPRSPGSSAWRCVGRRFSARNSWAHTGIVSSELNVLGEELQPCGTDPVTGFYRDGCCTSGPNQAAHLVCAVLTADFLEFQRSVGNDLITPMPEYGFPGLQPGDRWCVVAQRWLQAYAAGTAPPVVLASTNARALDVVELAALQQHAVDVPGDISSLE